MMTGEPRALVVDDDAYWQEILCEQLENNGLAVDVGGSLDEALSLLRSRPHRLSVVDLSLSSTQSHNTDGLRVLEAMRDLDPGNQAMLLTGFATVELAVSAMAEYGAFTVLRKESFNCDKFRIFVQHALMKAPVTSISTEFAPVVNTVQMVRETSALAGTALVVEDDAGWQSLLMDLLAEAGYRTRASSSFGEAIHYLRHENFTLAVIDLLLTGTGPMEKSAVTLDDLAGYCLLDCTRSNKIPTIVVSGIATPADIQRTYAERGIFAYIEKQTFDREIFLRLAEEACCAANADDKLTRLTEREREVLRWLVQGCTNKEIAANLIITPNTVKRHLKAIFEKLEVSTRAAAVAKAANAKE